MSSSVVSTNVKIQGGTPCFVGSRVPVSAFFDYIEGGYSVDEFLLQFPSVSREHVLVLLKEMREGLVVEKLQTQSTMPIG